MKRKLEMLLKTLSKINNYPVLTFLLNIQNVWNFIKWAYESIVQYQIIPINKFNMDFNTVIYFIITVALWLTLRAYGKTKDEIKSMKKDIDLFIKLQKELAQYRAYYQYKGNWVEYQKGFIDSTVIIPKFEAEERYMKDFIAKNYPDYSNKQINEILKNLLYSE